MDTNSREAAFARTIIYPLVFAAPLIVLPNTLADIFTTPKALLILTGVLLMTAVYYGFFLKDALWQATIKRPASAGRFNKNHSVIYPTKTIINKEA